MKQLQFELFHLENFLKFLELAGLNFQEKVVDSTSQNAWVTVFFNGKQETSIKDAEEMYLIQSEYIYSIFGVFQNAKHGIKYLQEQKERLFKNNKEVLQNMAVLFAKLEALNK